MTRQDDQIPNDLRIDEIQCGEYAGKYIIMQMDGDANLLMRAGDGISDLDGIWQPLYRTDYLGHGIFHSHEAAVAHIHSLIASGYY